MRRSNVLWVLPLVAVVGIGAGSVAADRPVAPPPRIAATAEQVAEGRRLFLKLQCIGCHSGQADRRAPNLEGLWGAEIPLGDGKPVAVNEEYVRESIRNPRAKIVKGWKLIMPAYGEEVVPEAEVAALVAYISRLKPGGTPKLTDRFPAPVGAPTGPPKK